QPHSTNQFHRSFSFHSYQYASLLLSLTDHELNRQIQTVILVFNLTQELATAMYRDTDTGYKSRHMSRWLILPLTNPTTTCYGNLGVSQECQVSRTTIPSVVGSESQSWTAVNMEATE